MMRLGKNMLVGLLAGTMCIGCAFTAFAGSWQGGGSSWWWQEDDGSYPVNTWKWLDGNGDGVAECYYFDDSGYCLMNTTTPDEYQVNENGAWVVNGIVQTTAGAVAAVETEANVSQETISRLANFADYVYAAWTDWGPSGRLNSPVSINIFSASLSSMQRAFLLYAYQYNYNFVDSRILQGYGLYDEENRASVSDMWNIMFELLGGVTESDMQAFTNEGLFARQEGNYYYMTGTGDFGDHSNLWYISYKNATASMENGRLKISGNVIQENIKTHKNEVIKHFQAYYIPTGSNTLGGYQFNQLIVQ